GRYVQTNGYNQIINRRQFGGVSPRHGLALSYDEMPFLPPDTLRLTTTYGESLEVSVGGLDLHLHHDRGETDDHTWVWVPAHRALCVGDLVTWVFPNAGNPQKVQRYPLEWARALRRMMDFDAELLLPAHGLPIRGADRIRIVLTHLAEALESLVEQTVTLMNEGATLDEIVHTVGLPDAWLERPWMRPVYDEPTFVVRNIWRLYGGWWDLDPSQLKPAPKSAVAAEIVALAGGTRALVDRAAELADRGELVMACHLIELAAHAEPDSVSVHGVRREIYAARRASESSLMSKGIFSAAARESAAITDG
ncbi:MAG: alkyl sulfatase dimerization domain-containing protein, partial [Actinomycetota bacterium]